jgi:hypothetical protein
MDCNCFSVDDVSVTNPQNFCDYWSGICFRMEHLQGTSGHKYFQILLHFCLLNLGWMNGSLHIYLCLVFLIFVQFSSWITGTNENDLPSISKSIPVWTSQLQCWIYIPTKNEQDSQHIVVWNVKCSHTSWKWWKVHESLTHYCTDREKTYTLKVNTHSSFFNINKQVQ